MGKCQSSISGYNCIYEISGYRVLTRYLDIESSDIRMSMRYLDIVLTVSLSSISNELFSN